MLRISADPIHAGSELSDFETSLKSSGAVVSFSGQVRPRADDTSVTALHLQAYTTMTENGIKDAMQDAKNRWPLEDMRVIHRVGDISAPETIVFVAVASEHRRAAFEATDFLMDYLKTKAVFWKKEITDKGERWIEPRAEDYKDSARWAEKLVD